MSRAIIYVRVSSQDQVAGFSLDVQERVCRDYAERHGWDIATVYREEGESAKTADRRELQRALAKLGNVSHFLVYDLTRLTRETADYFALKARLESSGVRLVSVTQPLDDGPTGKLMGTILASVGTFDNDMRREKTVAGMREAIKRGVWPWQAPIGYVSHRGTDRRATLLHDPETGPLVRLAFERIASGVVTQEEAREEIRQRGLVIPRETFSRMIHNPIYCGRIVALSFGIEGRLASKPLVSEETWRKAQEAISGSPSGWKRSDLRPDFPFRWWTRCAECARPLTGSYSKGKRGVFPYYRCPNGCQNLAREIVHTSFVGMLDSFACPPGLWRLWEAYLGDAYQTRAKALRAAMDGARRRLRDLETKEERVISALLDGGLDAPTVKRMRARIAAERAEINESTPTRLPEFEHALRIGRRLAETPRATWDALSPETRPAFLRVAFPARLDYDQKTGFRTPAKSLYIGNLTHVSGASCEKWYPQRDGLRTVDGVAFFEGWERLGPFFVEDSWPTDHP